MLEVAAHRSVPTIVRPFRTPRRVRRARTLRVFATLLVVTAMLVLAPQAVARLMQSEGSGQRYTVAKGDTLWAIASQYRGERDVRYAIQEIQKANQLEGAVIQPGQVLVIPAKLTRP